MSDGSLVGVAREIVTDFMDKKTDLNTGVQKKASELGLNTDQTARLIERTNTEAFLRVYPDTTEFEVASPEKILGIKTASLKRQEVDDTEEGLFKAASVKEAEIPQYEYLNAVDRVTVDDIFGLEPGVKIASAYEPAVSAEDRAILKEFLDLGKTEDEKAQEKLAKDMAIEEAVDTLFGVVKTAMLSGKTLGDVEKECIINNPKEGNNIRYIFDEYETKLATIQDEQELKRAPYDIQDNYTPVSDATRACDHLFELLRG